MEAGFDHAVKRLHPYLRALWGRALQLHPYDRPLQQQRPYLSELGIHLPPSWHAGQGSQAHALYRAAATHAAAHLAFSHHRFERKSLKPVQVVLISLLEDARVEQLAIDAFPGLRRLWLQCFPPLAGRDDSFAALALRLSRSLLDPTYEDDNAWIAKARQLYAASQAHGSDPAALREVGSLLGNDIGQMRLQFNARTYLVEPPYRDDNAGLWDSDQPPSETGIEQQDLVADASTDGAPPQQSPGEHGREVSARAVASGSEELQDQPVARYPEWDSRIGAMRPHWCSVFEPTMAKADPAPLQAAMARHAPLAARLARLIRAHRIRQPARLRRQPEGDRFDLDALVDAAIAVRAGIQPDNRVYMRTLHEKRSLSALVLLDLSASTSQRLGETGMLDAIREAAVLLAGAMAQNGDRHALHGFRSSGRHEVNYLVFKDFGDDFDAVALSRLAAVRGAQSTRIGAALRHATRRLADDPGSRGKQQLILIVTDGEPHDIDIFHPGYLMRDAQQAVREAASAGVHVFCVAVDREADGYVRRIFGENNYLVMDKVEDLPEKLPSLYLRLTR
jgi:nitric oxide reductase NorD protein